MSRYKAGSSGLERTGARGGRTAAPPLVVITSCGGLAPVRELRPRAVALVVESRSCRFPLPLTAAVTLTLVQVLA